MEDHSFFPETPRLDDYFQHAINVLENDHEALRHFLADFANDANQLIKMTTLKPVQMRSETDALHEHSQTIGVFLDRHLADEEQIVIPIILHHKFRG